MKRFSTVALLVAIGACSMSSNAFADEVFASTTVSTTYYNDHSFDAVSEQNAHSNLALTAGYEFDALAGLRLLALFQTSTRRDARRFAGDLDAEWGRQRIVALAEYGIDIGRFVRPFARAGAGYSHQVLAIDRLTGPSLKDHAHDLTAQGSLGLNLRFPLSFGSFGTVTDFGYEWQTPATFDELDHKKDAFDGQYAPDDDPWTREDASLGSLKMSGLFWSTGVYVAFEF